MPHSCCIIKCTSRAKKGEVSLHRIPKWPLDRREKWLSAIKRKDPTATNQQWTPTASHRVCGKHFITGKPHENKQHPDYVPSKELGYGTTNRSRDTSVRRFTSRERRQEKIDRETAAKALIQLQQSVDSVSAELDERTKDVGTQTDGSVSDIVEKCVRDCLNLRGILAELREENNKLKRDLADQRFTFNNVKKDIHFFAGVTIDCFTFLSTELAPVLQNKSISCDDQLLLVLMKIRHFSSNIDLALRFRISNSSVARVIHKVIPVLATFLRPLIVWPERDVCQRNMSSLFKCFPNVISTIDCFEVPFSRPDGLTARAQTWSNYKHCNTVKFLISITPCGAISFVSAGWGGRVSDKQITCDSGFLDKLEHGDEILADRGFLISSECAARGVTVHLPAFTKGKKQLTGKEVVTSRQLSRLRIHVERVIGFVKKYKILQGRLTINLVPLLDDIVVIVAGLVNLQPSLLPS